MKSVDTYLRVAVGQRYRSPVMTFKAEIIHVVEQLQKELHLCAGQAPYRLRHREDGVAAQPTCSVDDLLEVDNHVDQVGYPCQLEGNDRRIDGA